jgi:hypothetical protein
MDMDRQEQRQGVRPGVIAAGGMMLAVGSVMWIDSTGWVDVPLGRLIGPIVLMTLGALMVVEKGGVVYGYRERGDDGRPRMRSRKRGGTTGGLWLIGIGAWLMLVQTHAFGLDSHNSWPIFIIMSGIVMLIRGVR